MRRPPLLGLVVVSALLVVGALGACSDDEPSATPGTDGDRVQLVGDDIGGATLPGLGEDVERVELHALRGEPVVVNFWASTCPPCVQEMPALESVHLAAGGAVHFVGVAVNDRVDDALALADRTGVTYALATDPSGALFTAAGATLLPTTIVLDGEGEVVRRLTGEITAEELVAVLADETGVEVELA